MEILFTKEKYSKSDLTELQQFIPQWLRAQKCTDPLKPKNFHIVSYSATIAKAIYEDKDKTGNHNWWGKRADVRLVIRGSKSEFDKRTPNVGTRFSTGVNIDKRDDVLVVIYPCRYSDQYTKGEEGIFSSGLPSILQTVGRLRNGGTILFVIPPMPEMIECAEFDNLKKILPGYVLKDVTEKKTKDLKDESKIVNRLIQRQQDKIAEERKRYETEAKKTPNVKRPAIQYPSYETFLLEKGQDYLKYTNLKSGKAVTPYVLWAALNNQYVNCELKRIYYYSSNFLNVLICNDDLFQSMEKHLEEYIVISKFKGKQNYKDVKKSIIAAYKSVEKNGIIYKVSVFESDGIDPQLGVRIDDRKVSSAKLFVKQRDKLKIISYYFHLNFGSTTVFKNKNEYLRYRMDHKVGDVKLSTAYKKLDQHLKDIFNQFKGKKHIIKDILSHHFFSGQRVDQIKGTLDIIMKLDPILKDISVLEIDLADRNNAMRYVLEKFMKRGSRSNKGSKAFVSPI